MDELEMPQLQLLLRDERVKDAIEFLDNAEYQSGIDWINMRFTFIYGQQIDLSHDPDVVKGDIKDLKEAVLLELLKRYNVGPSRRLIVLWTYADAGIRLPLSLITRHIHDIWLPVIDDVFVLDLYDVWCLELYHEGNFSYGRYKKTITIS